MGEELSPFQTFQLPVTTITINQFQTGNQKELSKMSAAQRIAIVSVFDKTGLLDLAKGLVAHQVRILASGGTARMIRDSGFPVE